MKITKRYNNDQLSPMQADFLLKKLSVVMPRNLKVVLKNKKDVLATELHYTYKMNRDEIKGSYYVFNTDRNSTEKQICLLIEQLLIMAFSSGEHHGYNMAKKKLRSNIEALLVEA